MHRTPNPALTAFFAAIGITAALACAGCSDGSPADDTADGAVQQPLPDGGLPDGGLPDGVGRITYHFEGHAYRITDQAGAAPVDISAALDPFELSAGEDGAANLSADGEWLVLASERFHADCVGWGCLVRVPADLSGVEPILASGSVVHPEGFFAIASGGNLVLYGGTDGPHSLDLFAVRRVGTSWSAPVTLTSASSHAFHGFPAIHADGTRAVFNCGPVSFGESGICEVGTDGSGFREVLMPSHVPPGMPGPAVALHHPHYAPDDAIVFEGDWDGERIWRLSAGVSEPHIISQAFTNDNSPCVLPDGRIASLWLNRPGNPAGVHELKVMSADGEAFDMRVTGLELDDWGLGCGL